MKSNYKRKAYYLDEDVLLEGVVDKYGFKPDDAVQCGFSRQKVSKNDVGKILFYDSRSAYHMLSISVNSRNFDHKICSNNWLKHHGEPMKRKSYKRKTFKIELLILDELNYFYRQSLDRSYLEEFLKLTRKRKIR